MQLPNFTNKLFLAPMAGVNCTSFRLLCKEFGAGLIYTQMYHCDFIMHKFNAEGEKAVFDFVNVQEEEKPVSIQIVGNNPNTMADTAKVLQKKADIIDLNFGCPDPNMLKSKCGGYFSNYPEEMIPIVEAVKGAINKPISAKIRIGWESQKINGVASAIGLEKAGIDMLAIHGRTVVQKYAGKANWEIIKHIKNKLSIPIIANGDIKNAKAAVDIFEKTGCDYAMVGRRAMGDPGFFTRANNKLNLKSETNNNNNNNNNLNEIKKVPEPKITFLRFVKMYEKYDHDKSFSELKTHALWFSKRAAMGPRARDQIVRSQTVDEIIEIYNK